MSFIALPEIKKEIKKVAIVGAGVASLCAAHNLCDEFDVFLFEKESRVGGLICTEYFQNTVIELGPSYHLEDDLPDAFVDIIRFANIRTLLLRKAKRLLGRPAVRAHCAVGLT